MGFKFNIFTGNFDISGGSAAAAISSSIPAVDNSVVRYDGTTGTLVQDSAVTIDDSGNILTAGSATVGQLIDSGLTASTVPYANASKQLTSSAVTPTELGYVSGVTSAIQTQLAAKEVAANKGIANGYASLDSSALIPIIQIPPAALERLIVVADQTARYALTTATAQNGDTVKQTDTNTMYFIIDQTNLGNSAGYAVYSAGTSVNFSGSLVGDVTGTQGATVVSSAGGASAVELGYNAGVTSSVQTQLNGMFKLLGRSGGQTGIGGTGASDNLVLQSSSNATKGSVIIANQTGEKTTIGPTGSLTANNTHHILLPNTSSLTNGFVISENSSSWPATLAAAGPAGFQFIPKDNGGSAMIKVAAPSDSWQIKTYRPSDGTAQGYLSLGNPNYFQSGHTSFVALNVSAASGTTVDIQNWSDQTDRGRVVASVGLAGQMRASVGTALLPSQSFFGDTNTGAWNPTADTMAWSLGGVEKMRLSSAGVTVGVAGATTGVINVTGVTSGTVSIQPQSIAGTYNLNLPVDAGSSGQALISAGGGSSPMTWATPVLASTGDINQTSFTAADNQVAAANVTGLAFANASVRSFEAIVSVVRGATYAQYKLNAVQRASDWALNQSYVGDVTGLTFTITTAGQVQYTSTSTGNTATVKFRALTTAV